MMSIQSPSSARARAKLVAVTAALGLAAITTGCATFDDLDPSWSATPPPYISGETLIYTDGRKLQVTAVKGWRVEMTDQEGTRWVRTRNPALPPTRWQSKSDHGIIELNVSETFLWPPVAGQKQEFVAHQKRVGKARSSQPERWSCKVDGAEEIAVVAGTFDAIRYTCTRQDMSGADPRIIHYAPLLGKIIRESDHKTELVARLPPFAAMPKSMRTKTKSHVQQVLENSPSGQTFSRQVGGGVSSSITISTTYKNESGQFCRRYTQLLSGNVSYGGHYPALACRDAKRRKWVIAGQ